MLLPPLMATLELASASFAIMLAGSVTLAVGTVISTSRRVEAVVRAVTVAGAALPIFWFGFLLQYLFGMELGWLPLSGRGSWEHLVLPALTLAVTDTVVLTRILHSSVGRELRRTYVQVARAKGVREIAIVLRHVLPNALTALPHGVRACYRQRARRRGWSSRPCLAGRGSGNMRSVPSSTATIPSSSLTCCSWDPSFVLTSFVVDMALVVINGRTHGEAGA